MAIAKDLVNKINASILRDKGVYLRFMKKGMLGHVWLKSVMIEALCL